MPDTRCEFLLILMTVSVKHRQRQAGPFPSFRPVDAVLAEAPHQPGAGPSVVLERRTDRKGNPMMWSKAIVYLLLLMASAVAWILVILAMETIVATFVVANLGVM